MTRPRLSYNVAVYHRSFDGEAQRRRLAARDGSRTGPSGIGW